MYGGGSGLLWRWKRLQVVWGCYHGRGDDGDKEAWGPSYDDAVKYRPGSAGFVVRGTGEGARRLFRIDVDWRLFVRRRWLRRPIDGRLRLRWRRRRRHQSRGNRAVGKSLAQLEVDQPNPGPFPRRSRRPTTTRSWDEDEKEKAVRRETRRKVVSSFLEELLSDSSFLGAPPEDP